MKPMLALVRSMRRIPGALLLVAGLAAADDPVPYFRVNPSGDHAGVDIRGHGWPADATVTVRIGDDPANPDFVRQLSVDPYGFWGFRNNAYTVQAGDLVTVGDGTTTIENYVVTALTLTEVDVDDDAVSGTAAAGSDVYVSLYHEGVGRHVVADGDGNWTAVFGTPVGDGLGWNAAADLTDETWGGVCQCPADRSVPHGSTYIGFGRGEGDLGGGTPHFMVNAEYDGVFGDLWWEVSPWLPNTWATITIGDPEAPDHIAFAWIDGHGQWSAWELGHDIQPGVLVTVDDGVTAASHRVRNLVVDEVDVDASRVHGRADPLSWVGVSVHDAPVGRSVQADAEGRWTADFGVPAGDGQHHNQAFQLVPGCFGWAVQDHDGTLPHGTQLAEPYGATYADWQVPQPRFVVNPRSNYVWGYDWPAGQRVDVAIGLDLLEPDHEASVVADGGGRWWLDDLPVNIVAGMAVRAECGAIVKEHEVQLLGSPVANPVNDTVRGSAGPLDWVTVHIYGHGITRDVQADANGDWTADFSEPAGPEPWEAAYDLVLGSTGDAGIRDEDGDATFIPWRISDAPLEAHIAWHDALGDGPEHINVFLVEVEGAGILSARFRSPGEVWHELAANWWGDVWEFEDGEPTYADLATRFSAGGYRLELTTPEGVLTTDIDVPESLARPGETPRILEPLDGATGLPWPEVWLRWAAVAEPDFGIIAVQVRDEDDDHEVEQLYEDTGLTGHLLTELEPDTVYEAEVGFGNRIEGETPEGVPYELVRARWAFVTFATGTQPSAEMQARIDWYLDREVPLAPGDSWSRAENRDRFGKRMTLRQEFVADTDPNDPSSVFRTLGLEHSPGRVTVRFEPSSSLRLYTLQFAGDLRSGGWSEVPGAVQVAGGAAEGALEDGTAERPDRGCYRVLVEVP